MMKKVLIFIIFILVICPDFLFAQTAGISTEHCIRSGDELNRSVVSVESNLSKGQDLLWNLQGMELLDDDYMTRYGGVESFPWLVAGHEGLSGYQYLLTESSVYLLGRYSPTSQMTYDVPEQVQHFSMHYGDSIMGIYGGTGSYGDKLFVREYGNYVTRMDATGSIILPEGDTLRHVSRQTTDRWVYADIALADSLQMVYGDSIPVYTEDSIRYHIATDVPMQRVREERWYAAGYRYPILERVVCRAASDGSIISRSVLYYPPSAQEAQLPYDEENEAIRNLIARGEYHDETDSDANALDCSEAEPVIHYTLIQNAEARTVTISYDLDASATVRCVLADSKGVVYRTAEQTNAAGTGYSLALSYSGLSHGQYVVYISAGGLTQAVKFSAK